MMDAIDFVLEQEGGFVNDPADPGGATKFGISLRFLKSIDPELGDLDEDGDVDVEDIWALTEETAKDFYREHFYHPMGIQGFPRALGAVLLDTGVNMGKVTAIRMLQQALNQCGQILVVDGIAGPMTRMAVFGVSTGCLIRAFLLARIFRYSDLVDKHAKLKAFLAGWINRVQRLEAFTVQLAGGRYDI